MPGVIDAPNTPAQEMTAVMAMTTAPHGPTISVAASASGRSDAASPGSTPTHTSWISVYSTMTQATETRMANGTERRGSWTSPASTVVPSKPTNAYAASRMAVDRSAVAGNSARRSACGSTKNTPIATKPASGTILRTVNVVLTAAVCRMPRMLIPVYASTSAVMASARTRGCESCGQSTRP